MWNRKCQGMLPREKQGCPADGGVADRLDQSDGRDRCNAACDGEQAACKVLLEHDKNMVKRCKDTILATSIRNGKRFLGSNGCIRAATATPDRLQAAIMAAF